MRGSKFGVIIILPALFFVLLYTVLHLVFMSLTPNHKIPLKESVDHTYQQIENNLENLRESLYWWEDEIDSISPPLMATDTLQVEEEGTADSTEEPMPLYIFDGQ